MAEIAVSSVLQQLCQFVEENGAFVTGVERDFIDIKDELESIQALVKDAETKAADEGANQGIKTWLKQVREVSYQIDDVIDEYNTWMAQKMNRSIFRATLQKIPGLIRLMTPLHRIGSQIRDIKSSLGKIKDISQFYGKPERGSESYRGTKAPRIDEPRMASLFIEETQVVGFESPRDELVSYLLEGTGDLMLISIVGMGGLGKTTLAKLVYDNHLVKKHFDCRSFITVSQSYTMTELLTEMIRKLCKGNNEPIPKSLWKMDNNTLITHVRQHLQSKRYLLLFDDVWNEAFSDEIEHALISNNKGSRIIITTRKMNIAEYFKKSFSVHVNVHELQPLTPDKAWELFCNKVFRGQCPIELEDMTMEIVQKCGGLPLAIVAIGGLLSTKAKTMFEWRKVSQNLRMEFEHNVHLNSLTHILSLSYDDLPYHLKSCMLYFGIYPEDYVINRKRLTRQWMAEGFVKNEDIRPL